MVLEDNKRLKKTSPDTQLARLHLEKSEYNADVMRLLEKEGKFDWALNVGFYSIYHCFLALLSKYGFESRNQTCSITALLKLIDDGKLTFDKDLIQRFDILDVDKEAVSSTVRQSRELSTYGVRTEIDTRQLEEVKDLVVKVQRATIEVIRS